MPAATIANVAIAAQRGLVHVIGIPCLSASDMAVIRSVTARAVVVQSGNMSLGVNLLAALAKRVAQSLDEDFDIEILEMHHKAKIDAPSGTALMLGQAVADGRKISLDKRSARGRHARSSANRYGRSFRCDEQPVALISTASTSPARSTLSMARLAQAFASSSRPR